MSGQSDGADVVFVSRYIAKCIREGFDAADCAKNEIDEIDKYLVEAENKRLYRRRLLLVLERLGDDSLKRKRKSSVSLSSEDVDMDSDEMSEIQDKILKAVENGRQFMIRDIIKAVGSYEKDSLVIRCVKRLGDKGILSRTDDQLIVRGPKFPE
jgi:hypothetical protein